MVESFEFKFNRKPRIRTISEVHDLYIRSIERSNIKSKEILNCIDEIISTISPQSSGNRRYNDRYITHFYIDDILYQYSMSYEPMYDSYSTSYDRVRFEQGSIEEIRDRKINFLINNSTSLKLGEKYRNLSSSNRYYHIMVKCALEDMLIKLLDKKYEGVISSKLPEIIPIIIDSRRYIFKVDSTSHGVYKKFVLLGESVDDIVISI